ncbi:MAG: DUF2339 domain-containing protein [Gaiellaceae bacterium]
MTELTDRIEAFADRLQRMEQELYELRRLARAEEQAEEPVWSMFEREPAHVAEPVAVPVATEPPVPAPPATPPAAPPPAEPREPFDFTVLLGARALAWTGGVVMLLGIVFFFVLAVERGWIGAGVRVALGAAASALALGAAVWLRRRFGETYASLSSAGVGIAGFYATLLAATVLYDLVPSPVALAAAAAIAAVGAALAVWWDSETLASLGLLGAMLAPLAIAIQDGELSSAGTAFAAVVLAAATFVTVRRDWPVLHVAAVVVTAPQVIGLVVDHRPHATAVAAAFWLIYGAGAVWFALRTRLTYLPATLLMFSAAIGGYSAGLLYDGTAQGVLLLVVAGTYAAGSLALFRRDRDTSSLLWAIALTLAAIGAASLASGPTLTIVWAAEAAILAWLARRIAEPRFQLASLAWLALAFVHGLAYDAPPSKLFVENTDAWTGIPSAVSLAAACALVALCTFEWEPRAEGMFARLFSDLLAAQPGLRRVGYVLAGASALYAGSLGVVELPSTWDWGHVAVAALWSLVAVVLVFTPYRVAAFGVGAASAILVLGYDLHFIGEIERSWAFAIVAAALLAVAVVHEWRSDGSLDPASAAALMLSVGLATAAVGELLDDKPRGAGLLALAAGYGAIGVAMLARRRNFASALGIAALALAVPATIILLDGTWLVLAWAAVSAALALLARYEDRLVHGATAYLGLAFAHMLVFEAQPKDLFVAQNHPGSGVPAVLLVLAAAAVLAWQSERLRTSLAWICGALGLYAATLAILEVSEDLGGSVHTAFQRGHTAVSFLWGVVGLALLVVGLKRGRRHLQFGGFALFGLSLAKLFVYDLSFLSSIARAFSFLAVGALLVVGGFFYQRLASEART